MTYTAAENRYESIPYRRVGRSGLVLPALSLGLWHNFGDSTPIDTQRALEALRPERALRVVDGQELEQDGAQQGALGVYRGAVAKVVPQPQGKCRQQRSRGCATQ